MNVCSIRVVVLVTLHVSEPYSSTFFMLVLNILILFRVEKDGVFRAKESTAQLPIHVVPLLSYLKE